MGNAFGKFCISWKTAGVCVLNKAQAPVGLISRHEKPRLLASFEQLEPALLYKHNLHHGKCHTCCWIETAKILNKMQVRWYWRKGSKIIKIYTYIYCSIYAKGHIFEIQIHTISIAINCLRQNIRNISASLAF